jgi:ATP-dependent protease HslVU (ClpYQ) peptidase subunit
MTVIAVKIDKNKIQIASDSITVWGYTQDKGDTTKFSKLVEINDMLIGATGTCEEISLLQLFAQTTKPARADELGILDFLSQFVDWKNKKINKADLDSQYIIIYNKRVFCTVGWEVSQVLKYETIGAGRDYALAAMYLGHTAIEAVKVACELSIYCEKPIIYYEVEL